MAINKKPGLRHVKQPPNFGQASATPITSAMIRLGKVLPFSISKLIEKNKEEVANHLQKLPHNPGHLFRIKPACTGYLYSDIFNKNQFESMTTCLIAPGTIVMCMGKKTMSETKRKKFLPPEKKNQNYFAIWTFYHNESIWFVYANELSGPIEFLFEEIVFRPSDR